MKQVRSANITKTVYRQTAFERGEQGLSTHFLNKKISHYKCT